MAPVNHTSSNHGSLDFPPNILAPSIYHRCFRSIAYRCPWAPSGSPAEKLPHREGDSAASHGPTQSPSHGREDHPGHQVNRGTKKRRKKWCGRRRHDQFDSLLVFMYLYSTCMQYTRIDVNVARIHMPQWSPKILKAFD